MPTWSWSLAALAVGLSMDAAAVATARGLVARGRFSEGAALSISFGVFQGAMPALGWGLGALLGPWIEAWDHWVAFALLSALGAKMLHEAWKTPDDEPVKPLDARLLVMLSIATSIDAFAAGITLPALGAPVLVSVVTIGVTTCVLSGLGFALGDRLGRTAGRKLDTLGGVILIALGTKVLVEHMGWLE